MIKKWSSLETIMILHMEVVLPILGGYARIHLNSLN